MDNVYTKFFMTGDSEKKQGITQQSQIIMNDYKNFLDEFNQSNRKMSYSKDRILDLQDSGCKLDLNRSPNNHQLYLHRNQAKNTQTSIDIKGAISHEPRNSHQIQTELELLQTEQLLHRDQFFNSPSKTHIDTPKKSISKFRALGNLVVSIRRLQQNLVEQISSPDQLNAIKSKLAIKPSMILPLPKSNATNVNEILSTLKLVDRFIYHAEQGSQRDIQQMVKLLQVDPRRHVRCPSDPKHILNSFNKYGQNSLYIAAKNGNYEVMKFLLEHQANPHIKSKVYDNYYESPLEVSVRWNHISCAKLQLETCNYSTQDLKSTLHLTDNQELRSLILSTLSSQGTSFQCCL